MKKLLGISLVAMMAVTTANAQIASKAYVDSGAGTYVKANNTAGQNIKALDDVLGSGFTSENTVAQQIADAITTAGSNQVQANWTETSDTSKAYIQNKPTLGTAAALDSTSSVTDGGTDLPTAGAVYTAIAGAQSNLNDAIDEKVDKNDAITAGTHTKITYDAKGLVTAGADLAEADIPALSISKTTGLQAALDAKEVASNKVTEMTAQSTDDQYPSAKAVYDAIAEVQSDADNAVVANSAITAGTHTKITYDAKGLVTAGADITLSDVTDVTATAADVNQLAGKTLGTAAEAATASSVTQDGTGLPTAGAVYTAIDNAKTAATNAVTAEKSGTGNLVSSVTAANGKVTVTVDGVALQDPATSGSDGVYVLTASVADGQNPTYKWEQIARATGE